MTLKVVLQNRKVLKDGYAFAVASRLPDDAYVVADQVLLDSTVTASTYAKHYAREAWMRLGGAADATAETIEAHFADRYLVDESFHTMHAADPETQSRTPEIDRAVNPTHHKQFDRHNRQWLQNWIAQPGRSDTQITAAINVLADKYIDRLGRKDNKVQEVRKSIWYYRFGLLYSLGENTSANMPEDLAALDQVRSEHVRFLTILDCPQLGDEVLEYAIIALLRQQRQYNFATAMVLSTMLLHAVSGKGLLVSADNLFEVIAGV